MLSTKVDWYSQRYKRQIRSWVEYSSQARKYPSELWRTLSYIELRIDNILGRLNLIKLLVVIFLHHELSQTQIIELKLKVLDTSDFLMHAKQALVLFRLVFINPLDFLAELDRLEIDNVMLNFKCLFLNLVASSNIAEFLNQFFFLVIGVIEMVELQFWITLVPSGWHKLSS